MRQLQGVACKDAGNGASPVEVDDAADARSSEYERGSPLPPRGSHYAGCEPVPPHAEMVGGAADAYDHQVGASGVEEGAGYGPESHAEMVGVAPPPAAPYRGGYDGDRMAADDGEEEAGGQTEGSNCGDDVIMTEELVDDGDDDDGGGDPGDVEIGDGGADGHGENGCRPLDYHQPSPSVATNEPAANGGAGVDGGVYLPSSNEPAANGGAGVDGGGGYLPGAQHGNHAVDANPRSDCRNQ